MVADFETRTFINFTYFSVFFIGSVISLSLLDQKNELPVWAWVVPLLFVSKPSVMAILPAIMIAAVYRSGRMRSIAVVSVVVCLFQLIQLYLSARSGWTPLQSSDSSLFYKGYLAIFYTLALFARFIVGPSFQSSVGFFVGVGTLATFLCAWLAVKSKSSRPLVLVGYSLVFFTALLNCLAFGLVWDSSFQPVISGFSISRYVITAYIGFVFVVAAFSTAFMSVVRVEGRGAYFGSVTGLLVFLVWFLGAGWASYGSKISHDWVAPSVGNSYWKDFSSSIDQGVSPLCVPIDPFPWLYGRNCEWLTPPPEQAYILKRILQSKEGFVVDVPVPESVQSGKLISLGVFIKPASDLDVSVHAFAVVDDVDGNVFKFQGERIISATGGLFLLTQASGVYVGSAKRIRIFFDRGVDMAYQQHSELQPSIIFMGARHIPESISSQLKRANSGDVKAQLEVGKIFGEGRGVEKNLGEAVNWYIKASNNNNSEAQYLLAQAFYYGVGVSQNEGEALIWYRKAAELGNEDAIRELEKFNLEAK